MGPERGADSGCFSLPPLFGGAGAAASSIRDPPPERPTCRHHVDLFPGGCLRAACDRLHPAEGAAACFIRAQPAGAGLTLLTRSTEEKSARKRGLMPRGVGRRVWTGVSQLCFRAGFLTGV